MRIVDGHEVEMVECKAVGHIWQDSHGNQGTAQIYGAGLGMGGMPRGRSIPIAAGGIPLERRHDVLWNIGRVF